MAHRRLLCGCVVLLLLTVVRSGRRDVDDEDDADDNEFEGAPVAEQPRKRGKRGKRKKAAGRGFTLMHSFDGEKFLPRARLELQTSKLSQHRVVKFAEAGVMLPQELETFQALVKRDGFYRIRVVADAATASPFVAGDVPYVVASIRACQLLLHQFEEQLLFHMDDSSNIVGLEYTNPHTPDDIDACPTARLPKRSGQIDFKSSATVFIPLEALAVPLRVQGNPFIPGAMKVPAKGKDGKPVEEAPQPGFFRRYWYIIVPVGLLMVMSSAMDPEAMAKAQEQAAARGK